VMFELAAGVKGGRSPALEALITAAVTMLG
jgi:hypothetical protein